MWRESGRRRFVVRKLFVIKPLQGDCELRQRDETVIIPGADESYGRTGKAAKHHELCPLCPGVEDRP